MQSTRLRYGILALYMALFIAAPCVGLVWFTTSQKPGTETAPLLLLFVSLPVYAVYIGIYVKTFFPKSILGALAWPLPLLINYILSYWLFGFDSAFKSFIISETANYAGLMLLLCLGLVALAYNKAKTEGGMIPRVLVMLIIVTLTCLPAIKAVIAGAHAIHAAETHRFSPFLDTALYVSEIAIIAFSYYPSFRKLYRDGAL